MTLSGGTELVDVIVSGIGRVSDGEVAVVFNPSYGAEPFVVHIARGEKTMTLDYNPFSGRVKVIEGHV